MPAKTQNTLWIVLTVSLIVTLLLMLGAYLMTQTTMMDGIMGVLFHHTAMQER
ncbi:MAG: hypothetical protein AB1469_02110 [Pseudomonadota bacterium]